MIDKKLAEAARKLLTEVPPEAEEKEVAVAYDGRQFLVRIPAKFSKVLKLDAKRDRFRFVLVKHPRPRLTGGLVRQ